MKLLTLLLTLFVCVPVESHNGINESHMIIMAGPDVNLTFEERIVSVLLDSGITDINMQKIMIAQAKLESGNFKNKLTVEHNNIYSLHHSKRDTLSIGKLGVAEGCACFASYRSIEDGTRAYLRLIHRMQIPREANVKRFATRLREKKYFTAPLHEYQSNLEYWVNSMNDSIFKTKPNLYGRSNPQQRELLEN